MALFNLAKGGIRLVKGGTKFIKKADRKAVDTVEKGIRKISGHDEAVRKSIPAGATLKEKVAIADKARFGAMGLRDNAKAVTRIGYAAGAGGIAGGIMKDKPKPKPKPKKTVTAKNPMSKAGSNTVPLPKEKAAKNTTTKTTTKPKPKPKKTASPIRSANISKTRGRVSSGSKMKIPVGASVKRDRRGRVVSYTLKGKKTMVNK